MQLVVADEQLSPPGDEVAVYEVIVPLPVAAGAVQDTTDWALAFDVAVTMVGVPGVPATREFEAAEAAPVPAELMAATV